MNASRRRFLGLTLLFGSTLLVACAPEAGTGVGDKLIAWPAQDRWPDPFSKAAPEVQQAYRFAVANPKVLQYIPCFCGCGASGHKSNSDCYVREFRPDGSVLLDPMSFG